MARKKSKQQGVTQKEIVPGKQTVSKSTVSPGDAAGGGGGDAGLDRLASTRANQPMHTCCLLCHREFKDWGANSVNGLPGGHGTKLADAVPALSQALLREASGRKLADAVPSLSQSLLGEVPLWICQSCCKSVEEEERRSTQEHLHLYHCLTHLHVSLKAVETVTQNKVRWIGTPVLFCQPTNCQDFGTLLTAMEVISATTTVLSTPNKDQE
ncbi:hypothetical protein WMY93_009022 [Mugilogobius chulae]|uniref:Uncharacterized protein n=1 Tax=Mugilogobius chulae TaxID=88201 RepID=A0AAW0PE74_9GOBI